MLWTRYYIFSVLQNSNYVEEKCSQEQLHLDLLFAGKFQLNMYKAEIPY